MYLKFNLKEIENKQQLSPLINSNGTIKKVMKLEKEWQNQKIEKNQNMKQKNLRQLQTQIQKSYSSMKIERCHYCLNMNRQAISLIKQMMMKLKLNFIKLKNLLNYQKSLMILFVFENPNDFELDEILHHV
ncbi:unnamed protein product (macronuclear) [Paramecium tetraurelia]|uniref:Uncharacterized protein n=1 Tax=Paramecium tetraurelia TaxID=5888 RepID=A0BD67_PARTE|nr:uncharacterized protein GSPATT00004578001 [Paramecium tetraurelia]CAK56484.1 unnamed protein product [Paramecium tetraurelia]|eukprot:XP_001423882.1 hypothetical protein (macronuclear) [Paramecium tetraurelia strain d4-2]